MSLSPLTPGRIEVVSWRLAPECLSDCPCIFGDGVQGCRLFQRGSWRVVGVVRYWCSPIFFIGPTECVVSSISICCGSLLVVFNLCCILGDNVFVPWIRATRSLGRMMWDVSKWVDLRSFRWITRFLPSTRTWYCWLPNIFAILPVYTHR